MARAPFEELDGTERQRAQDVTHTVVGMTCALNVMDTIASFEHPEQRRNIVPTERATYVMHSNAL